MKRGCNVMGLGLGALVLLVMCGLFFTQTSTQESASSPTAVATQRLEPILLPTLRPTVRPTPTHTLTPFQQLRATLTVVIDEDRLIDVSWHPDDSTIHVTFASSDNFTEDWIKSGIRMDMVDMLHAIHTGDTPFPYQSIVIEATFPMRDVYGNTNEQTIVKAAYSRGTLDKINWTGFRSDNILLLANDDTLYIHPAMNE